MCGRTQYNPYNLYSRADADVAAAIVIDTVALWKLCEGSLLPLIAAMFRPPGLILSDCRPMFWWSTGTWGRGQTPPRRLLPFTRPSAWTEQTTQMIPWAKVTNRGDSVRWNDNQVLPSDASSCAIKKKLKLNNYQHVPTVLDICDNSRKFSPSGYKKYITLILLYLPLSINTFLISVCMMYCSFVYRQSYL